MTSRDLSDTLDSKPLGKFGSASIRKPVSEAIAKANEDDARLNECLKERG